MHLYVNPSVPFCEGCKGYLVFFLFLSHVTLGVPVISFRFYMFVLWLDFPGKIFTICHRLQPRFPSLFLLPSAVKREASCHETLMKVSQAKNPRLRVSLPLFCFFCSFFFRFRFSLRTEVMEGNVPQHTHSQNSTGLITSITSSTLGATEVLHFVFILNFDSFFITFRAASGITWRHLHQLLPSSSSSRRLACKCRDEKIMLAGIYTHCRNQCKICRAGTLIWTPIDLIIHSKIIKPNHKAKLSLCLVLVPLNFFYIINWHFGIEIIFLAGHRLDCQKTF